MDAAISLLPCPVCGTQPIILVHSSSHDWEDLGRRIVCQHPMCVAGPWRPTLLTAAQAWNNLAKPTHEA